MIFIEPPEHYLQKKLQMLWLVAYLTGVPPVGLHALRCFCRGQAPDGSKVLLPEQLSSLELEQLLGSPLNLTVNPFFAGDRHWMPYALSGLSCYILPLPYKSYLQLFQCPHGLELLPQKCPIF